MPDAFLRMGSSALEVWGMTRMSPSLKFLSASSSVLATHSLPKADRLLTPCPVTRMSPTTWTLSRLVVPLTPSGTPAVMTTMSPSCTYPAAFDFATAWAKRSSVFSFTSQSRGVTPHERASCQ